MKYFAELNEENIVIRVISADSLEWVETALGGVWLETFDNGSSRFNFAAIGYTYDSIDDAFIAPMPCEHDELILNDKKEWKCSNEAHIM